MFFADDQNVVEAFAAYAAEKPLADPVAVRRGWWRFDDGSSSAGRHAVEEMAELAIVVSDEEPWSVLEGHCFSKLLSGPLVRWLSCDVEVDDFTTVEVENEEREYGSEGKVIEL